MRLGEPDAPLVRLRHTPTYGKLANHTLSTTHGQVTSRRRWVEWRQQSRGRPVALPTTVKKGMDGEGRGSYLLVMGPDGLVTRPLPTCGEVVIGRDEDASIRLTDPLASRHHVKLYIGENIEVEDLGSSNGTRVREQTIPPHERIQVAPGESISVGSTVLMVQVGSMASRSPRIWPSMHFLARLEQECVRAAMLGSPLAIARIRLPKPIPDRDLVETASAVLRTTDLVATYARNQYDLLLPATSPEDARTVVAKFAEGLAPRVGPVRTGVAHYPYDGRSADALIARANTLLSPIASTMRPGEEAGTGEAVVEDEAMRRLWDTAARAARKGSTVLILGETGVGKGVLAEYVHRQSARAHGSFVRLNCGAIPEALLESELFGHSRGSFTGATGDKRGLLELADGGTLFLDEIGEMPLSLQVKLLRVLEKSGTFRRLGEERDRRVDMRLIAATNRNLQEDIERGKFRADLYYRINVVPLEIPPLRRRRPEIVPLARKFIREFARRQELGFEPRLSADAQAALEGFAWPGNVRQLENAIERAFVLCEGHEITLADLPSITAQPADPLGPDRGSDLPEMDERQRIVEVLRECGGNQTWAAERLGMSRPWLNKLMKRYELPRPHRRPGLKNP